MAENRDKDAPEEERGFTISDRRHWAKEEAPGEPSKAEVEAALPPPPEPETPPKIEEVSGEAVPPTPPAEEEAPPRTEEVSPPEAATPPKEAEVPPEELPAADFSYLVVFLAAQAMLCMGEQPDPTTGETMEKNLPGAKHAIDLLGVIQDKTQGNLSDEEHQLLEGVLYDLRMRYVQAAGPAAS